TGAQHGGFDVSWLMANLEVEKIPLAIDEDEFDRVDSLVLGRKALQAAESYVLGLFHLYFTVYYHKTTRAFEQMLSALLARVGFLVVNGDEARTGLSHNHPILEFLRSRTLADYLRLDDFVIWSAISLMQDCEDAICKALASRILHRKPYKAIDVERFFEGRLHKVVVFKSALRGAMANGEFGDADVFEDTAVRNPYKRRSGESPEALSKIWIKTQADDGCDDLSSQSSVVKQLEERKAYRVYARTDAIKERLEGLLGRI
ncbi:MAG: hypothetical protein P4L61_03435, partial [Candidatus Pacebacteria bacterium]|nr:hypothetical protein [Candidatus Paceibacterota bacterium]